MIALRDIIQEAKNGGNTFVWRVLLILVSKVLLFVDELLTFRSNVLLNGEGKHREETCIPASSSQSFQRGEKITIPHSLYGLNPPKSPVPGGVC
ncbi:jg7353 [Pararge aegeria aegeria]|uniref:Jg7353 protein n=1 Tax=Pararge aegeria aegeria TaxID=348720 RepID=A0A8S4RJQ0_9NEOP|nr:jg7353 [Pararge aegeria aegeria]